MFEGKMQLHEIEKRKWIVYLTDSFKERQEKHVGESTDYDNFERYATTVFRSTVESQRHKFRDCRWNCRPAPEEYFAQKSVNLVRDG